MTQRRLNRLEEQAGVGRRAWAKNAAELDAALSQALELTGSEESSAARQVVTDFRAAYAPDMDSDGVADLALDQLKAALSLDTYAALIAILQES